MKHMKHSAREMQLLLRQHHVLALRRHPELAGSIRWKARTGELKAVLPGIYAPVAQAADPFVRISAACAKDPNGILLGKAAAKASFWPELRLEHVEVSYPHRHAAASGFLFRQRLVPPELIVEHDGLRLTSAALTSIDLVLELGGAGIDEALRTGAATLSQMYQAFALTPNRPGNAARLWILHDSRDQPWSEAERLAHRLFRSAGLKGWLPNMPILLDGRQSFLDIAFPRERLAIEIDGYSTHRLQFESDRARQNRLASHGWTVLRFTWTMLTQEPEECIRKVRRCLALARASRVSA